MVDGTGIVSTISGAVNTESLGTYTLTYIKTDVSGNIGSMTRTVNVVSNISALSTAKASAGSLITANAVE